MYPKFRPQFTVPKYSECRLEAAVVAMTTKVSLTLRRSLRSRRHAELPIHTRRCQRENCTGSSRGHAWPTLPYHCPEKPGPWFPGGCLPTVGAGGHLSGGGYGMLSRRHGIAADQIIDARLVNADGEILDRRTMGEDLFWAIRGGGGSSFGIVVEFKVKLVTIPETVTVFNVTRTSETAVHLAQRWQYIADKVNENLLLRLFLGSVKSPTTGNRIVSASFKTLYLGRVRDLLPLMQEQFPELGTEMSWIESVLFFARLANWPTDILLDRTQHDGSSHVKGKSDYVTAPISVDGVRGIWRFLHEEDECMAQVQFSPYGGILDAISESETPLPHRSGNLFSIHYAVTWANPHESERHMDWIRRLYSYMAPYVTQSPRAAYFNYRDLDIRRNNNVDRNTSYEEASV